MGTLETSRAALSILEGERVMTLVPIAGSTRRSLVAEVVGGPVKGSWWAHPQGNLIYRISEELEASGDVLVCKLVAGKVTFVHRALWPAVLRVVLDAGWRKRTSSELAADALSLLEEVEAQGKLRLGKQRAAARKALEAAQLALSTSEHTERGAHLPTLQSWKAWASEAGANAARGSLKDALGELAAVDIAL